VSQIAYAAVSTNVEPVAVLAVFPSRRQARDFIVAERDTFPENDTWQRYVKRFFRVRRCKVTLFDR
jgi:hypothetical protein